MLVLFGIYIEDILIFFLFGDFDIIIVFDVLKYKFFIILWCCNGLEVVVKVVIGILG